MFELIDKLERQKFLEKDEFVTLIKNRTPELSNYLFEKARKVSKASFGNNIFIRGLIEFTNFCKNDCLYCGIRKSNKCAERYRLTKEQILLCCEKGYKLGFRTFVLQGGEDDYFNDERMIDIVSSIKRAYPDCALTLSIGEKSKESYQKLFNAGADRYLLRHETANEKHYEKLHDGKLSLKNRKECLFAIKEIGFQTGAGFMVGSPFQTATTLAEDLMFLKELSPEMVGIGPFIPHADTPFKNYSAGTVELTLFMLGLVRLTLPKALLPATTALATLDKDGRKKGILAGANVVMPNLTPKIEREKYSLYNDKATINLENAENKLKLETELNSIDYHIVESRGDYQD